MIWDAFNIYMVCLLSVFAIGGIVLTRAIGLEYEKFVKTVRRIRSDGKL